MTTIITTHQYKLLQALSECTEITRNELQAKTGVGNGTYDEICANASLAAQAPQMLIDVTRLQGENKVMLDLMDLSLGVMETITPDDCDSADELDKLIAAFRAVLAERRVA